jgi:hypothetical protein
MKVGDTGETPVVVARVPNAEETGVDGGGDPGWKNRAKQSPSTRAANQETSVKPSFR